MAVHYFDPNGVESLRDNGYRDTAMALAELIDNSIQAEATKVEVLLFEKLSATQRKEFLIYEVVVADNGHGMDGHTLETSLRFGGGTRHAAKKGLGKFGMGLPNSSASQCPRFEVYTWKSKETILFNYFDFKEIKKNQSEYLPDVISSEIPKPILDLIKPLSNSGTIVRWMHCDRLNYRRSKKLVQNLEWQLGRIFRYFIHNNNLEINIRVIQSNGYNYSENKSLLKKVSPVDPLFLMTGTQLPPPYIETPASQPWENGEFLFPDPNGDKRHKELYSIIKDSIKVKISIAKPETKRSQGGIHTEKGLGKIYREFQGLSIVRANREIKLGEFGFITDISDPRNRWWKIEINFEPFFDSFFGLDNTKQNVHSFRRIDSFDAIDAEDEDITFKFISGLSEFIENQISELKKAVDNIDKGSRGGGTNPTPTPDNPTDDEDPGPFPGDTVVVPSTESEPEEEEPETDAEREELRKWLLDRYPEYSKDEIKLSLAIEWFFSTNYKQIFVFLQLGPTDIYDFDVIGSRTLIEINIEHEFYREFIKPIFDEGDIDKIHQILLLFGSMVESEKRLTGYKNYIQIYRGQFGLNLGQFILDWKENR